MRRKSFGDMQCPIARSLERVGEWWSILILRDASLGLTRFDQFQKSLGIAPNMLTRRLNTLVEAGLLERRRYSDRPPRDEYVLTQAGRDFRPVLWALLAWGNKHFAPEGPSVVIVDSKTGAEADPMLVDRISGRPLDPADFRSAPGPAASARPGGAIGRAAGGAPQRHSKSIPTLTGARALSSGGDTDEHHRARTFGDCRRSNAELRLGRKQLALAGLALAITVGGIGYGRYWWDNRPLHRKHR